MSAHLSGCDQCGGPINGEQYCGDCMAYAAARIVSLEVQLQQVQADYGDLDHEVARLKMEMDVCGHAERIYEVTHLRGERDEYGALFLKACSEIVDEPHEDIRRTEYVVKLEKTLAAIEAWATECSAQGICGTAVRDIREIIDATEGGEENAMRLKPVQETDLTARLAEAERERDAEAARHGKTLLRAEAAEAEVARLRGILDLVDSVDDCGVMRPPHVVVDMIRDALAVEEE